MRKQTFVLFVFAIAIALFMVGAAPKKSSGGLTIEKLDKLAKLPGELAPLPAAGLPPGPAQVSKIELGRELFFDKRLSGDHTMSCATCHDPEKGFADALPLGKGFGGKQLRRHSPTVLN